MDRDSWINVWRRKVTHSLTSCISRDKGDLSESNSNEIRSILVVRPNSRLGNQLMVTPLLQELERFFPEAKVDIFVKSWVAPTLFGRYKNVGEIIIMPAKPKLFKQFAKYFSVWFGVFGRKYDLVVNVVGDSSSGRLTTRLVGSKYKLFGYANEEDATTIEDYCHLAKSPVYALRRYMQQSDITQPAIPTLDIQLSADEVNRGGEILDSIVSPERPTIGIYTFATGKKCFSKEWWADTYQQLLDEFGQTHNIIEVLPIENVSQIDFKAPSYYSRDIREMLGVMDHFAAFVTADCGIMHLASATSVPVVSIFSTTPNEIFRPYNAGSIDLKAAELKSAAPIIESVKCVLNR